MGKVFCKYCGRGYSDERSLQANSCPRHPNGGGKHAVFEGTESSVYICANCGREYRDLSTLTANSCMKHPTGRGHHSPA